MSKKPKEPITATEVQLRLAEGRKRERRIDQRFREDLLRPIVDKIYKILIHRNANFL